MRISTLMLPSRIWAAVHFSLALAILGTSGSRAAATNDQAPFLDRRPTDGWPIMQPRGRTRDISFDTTEGTWMSLDVSPDGLWIIFDLLGHVYRLSVSGGDAQCLTQDAGISLNFQPKYSPDGAQIAFISDRAGQESLWVMNADGSSPSPIFTDPITKILEPSWYPDGTAIAAVREFPTYSMHRRSARIWRFPIERSIDPPRELVGQASGSQAYWPTVARDGKSLYYMTTQFAAPLSGDQYPQALRRLDLASGADEPVTPDKSPETYNTGNDSDMAPEISPDGRWLAFVRRLPGASTVYRGHTFDGRSALWLRDLQQGRERVLLDRVTLDMQHAHGMKNLGVVPGYAWHPDSKSLYLWRDGGIVRVALDGSTTVIPFKAKVRRMASEQTAWTHGYDERTFHPKAIRWPVVSDTTGQLIFEAVGEIWQQPLAPRSAPALPLVRWTNEAGYAMPQISPDGRRLTFVSWNDRALGAVWICDLPDCAPKRVSVEAARYLYPIWLPDNKTVVALRSHVVDAQRLAAYDTTVSYDLVVSTPEGEKILATGLAGEPFDIDGHDRIFQLHDHSPAQRQRSLAEGKAMAASESVLVSFNRSSPGSLTSRLSFPAATRAVLSPREDFVAYEEEGELYLARTRRDMAEYAANESFRWEGEPQPLPLVKENPLHEIRRLSVAGAHHTRWIDNDRLIYVSGDTVYQYNRRTERTTESHINLTLPKATPAANATMAFVGARLVTLRGSEVIESGDLVTRGGRLLCIGHCDTSKVDHVVHIEGKTVVPGWIDVHAHGDYDHTSPIVPQQYFVSALYLSQGVTTVWDPYAASNDGLFSIAEQIEMGRVTGPRTFSTGAGLDAQAPQTGPRTYGEALAEVQSLSRWGATAIKTFLPPRRDQRQMYIQAARELGLAATTEGRDLYYDIGIALDGHTGFEHPIQNGILYRDVVEFLAKSKIVYTPTLVIAGANLPAQDFEQPRGDLWNDNKLRRFLPYQLLREHVDSRESPKAKYIFPFWSEGIADIRRAGGFAAIGGHGQLWGLDTHWEMWAAAEGQTPLEVLAMASRDGAHKIGMEKDLGSLEPGKLADFVVLGANPLDDIHNTREIVFVVKAGVQYDANTLNELWPTQIAFGTPPWYRADIFEGVSSP